MNLIDTIKNAHHQGAHRTFGAAHMVKQPMKRIDPSTLEVCDDPIPGHRASSGNKYETVLLSLKHGQCVKCAPSEVGGVAGALRKLIEHKKLTGAVRTMKNYGDGKGRVWLMAPVESKAKLAAVRG